MWDLPRPGREPVSPALAGRLSTTVPPGKPQFHSFSCGYLVVPTAFVKETILSPLNGLGTLVENQLAIDIWIYFWALTSIPLLYIYLSILVPVPYYFNYCRFLVSFEIRKCESSHFVFLFQYCFGC